jgi:hypothetical protein
MYSVDRADIDFNFFSVGVPTLSTVGGHDGYKPHGTKPRCDRTGWTDWMSSKTPTTSDPNDKETLTSLRLKITKPFCDFGQQKSIECRKVGTNEKVPYTGEDVTCSLKHGLLCTATDKPCSDYQVRFYCDCGECSDL